MPSMRQVRARIRVAKNSQQITKAMKMVAASRLKKAKNLVESSRSYAYKLAQLTSDLASNIAVRGTLNQEFPLLTGKGNNNIHLLVVISSDRGLCGGLNTATVKFVKQTVTQLLNQGREVKIFCLGKKAYEPLKNVLAKNIIGNQFGLFRGIVNFNDACQISEKIIELFRCFLVQIQGQSTKNQIGYPAELNAVEQSLQTQH
jgi:F-type H+-transporting ATPase subunit gamma